MIEMHHKFRAKSDLRYPLVEVFRKADLVDVSLGLMKFGVTATYIKRVKAESPN